MVILMYLNKVVSYFGGKKINIAKKLGVTTGYVSQWGEIIPESMATKLAVITDGKLKYQPALYSKSGKRLLTSDSNYKEAS
jgi:prolyl-tRNA editing enzyme YbaK/EbsC (Cys-tRNA(Pro) deacylase)